MSKTYIVAAGVSWVNGEPVHENSEVSLSVKEAQFDLDQGRLVEKVEVTATQTADPAPAIASSYNEEMAAPVETRKRGR